MLLLHGIHAACYMEAMAWGRNLAVGYKRQLWGRHLVSPNTRSGISPTTYRDNDPGHQQRFFREQLQRHSRGLKRVLLGGDFNCVPNLHLDNITGPRGTIEIKHVCSSYYLVVTASLD